MLIMQTLPSISFIKICSDTVVYIVTFDCKYNNYVLKVWPFPSSIFHSIQMTKKKEYQ